MKSILLATTMLAAAGAAQAQSNVSVYGLMDVNVEYRNHNDAAQHSRWGVNSGGMNTSRWGLRGNEDLGGGLKAVFQLEAEVAMDTGAAATAFWSRQANVGLEGSFGRLVAGRSYSTSYDFLLPYDPLGYAPQYSWLTSAGATGNRKDGMLTGVSNLLKYTGKFDAFQVGGTYAFGEEAGSLAPSAKYALAVGYAPGPFGVVAVYDQVNGTAVAGGHDVAKSMHLAGTWQLDPVKLTAGVRRYDKSLASGAADQESSLWWLGAAWQATPALTLTAAIYQQDIRNVAPGTDADPRLLVARARYALSKRTDLYAVAGYAKAKNGQAVGLSRDDVAFGNTQTGVSAGIQHRF